MAKKLVSATTKIVQITFCALMIVSLVACAAPRPVLQIDSDTSLRTSLKKAAAYPEANFIVFSDPHIYDYTLGTTGKAFEDYIAADRKLVREGPEVLDSAISSMSGSKATFVLCAGDLTKDGELASHLLAAQYLAKLKASGKKVYVVPGNHDIKNGHSYKYVGDSNERTPNVSPEEFAKIYNDFGFNDALQKDSNSLSYVVEPVPGLWLLALDANRYKENVEGKEPITDGKFNPQTLTWIESRLGEAAKANKAVIVMMHHNVVEHYVGQEKNYGEWIVDDYKDISRLFAAYNVRMVFTGHYHAQDITEAQWTDGGNKFLFDIETGSLVTYPCPYRIVELTGNQQAVMKTGLVTSIKSHPQDFPEYAKDYFEKGIAVIATKTLKGYGVGQAEAERLSTQIAKAFVAHSSGDESLPAGQEMIQEQNLSPLGWVVIQMRKDLVYGLWKDLPPPDNNVTLDMNTGGWK